MIFSNIKPYLLFPVKCVFPGWFIGTLAHTHTSLISSPTPLTHISSLFSKGSLFSSSSCSSYVSTYSYPESFPPIPPPTSFSKQSLSLITLPLPKLSRFFPPPSSFLPGKIPLPSFHLFNHSHSNQIDLSKNIWKHKSLQISKAILREKKNGAKRNHTPDFRLYYKL